MMGPTDTIENQTSWTPADPSDALLFPETGEDAEFSDLICEMNSKLDDLADLCQRLSFSMREIGQILKIKPQA